MNVTATGPVYTDAFPDFVLYDAGNGDLAMAPQYLATVLYTATPPQDDLFAQLKPTGIPCPDPNPVVPNHLGPPSVL
jgi:hypothetical protein